MTDQSDVERDALEVMRALAGLHGHLARRADGTDEPGLRELAAAGGAAAGRVLAYLRDRRGAGDGAEISYPERLGPWRDWCPPRGDVLGRPAHRSVRNVEIGDPGPPRHGDPGE